VQWLTRSFLIAGPVLIGLGLSGCAIVEVNVTNPVPGLTTVAVAPFFNVSSEPAVDGRRFALAYFTELQKTPGFQVVPVGIVEQSIFDNDLKMSSPADVLRLADLLGVDAVVVGAITDYSPYYPPRIGLQVSWYSPREWTFFPGIPLDENARHAAMSVHNWSNRFRKEHPPEDGISAEQCQPAARYPESVVIPDSSQPSLGAKRSPAIRGQNESTASTIVATTTSPPLQPQPVSSFCWYKPWTWLDGEIEPAIPAGPVLLPYDPLLPFMSYTRMFDGADQKLIARLRDYVELSGDKRSGGWEGHLQRSEDYIRFCSHVMIKEMFQLHGGEAQRRVVYKMRKHR
jgi:hypothetical protein